MRKSKTLREQTSEMNVMTNAIENAKVFKRKRWLVHNVFEPKLRSFALTVTAAFVIFAKDDQNTFKIK